MWIEFSINISSIYNRQSWFLHFFIKYVGTTLSCSVPNSYSVSVWTYGLNPSLKDDPSPVGHYVLLIKYICKRTHLMYNRSLPDPLFCCYQKSSESNVTTIRQISFFKRKRLYMSARYVHPALDISTCMGAGVWGAAFSFPVRKGKIHTLKNNDWCSHYFSSCV